MEVHIVIERVPEKGTMDDVLRAVILRPEPGGVDVRGRRVGVGPL